MISTLKKNWKNILIIILFMYIAYDYMTDKCPSCPHEKIKCPECPSHPDEKTKCPECPENICPPQKDCPNIHKFVTLKILEDVHLSYTKLKKGILKVCKSDDQIEMGKALEIIMSGYVSIAQLDPRYYDRTKNSLNFKVK